MVQDPPKHCVARPETIEDDFFPPVPDPKVGILVYFSLLDEVGAPSNGINLAEWQRNKGPNPEENNPFGTLGPQEVDCLTRKVTLCLTRKVTLKKSVQKHFRSIKDVKFGVWGQFSRAI